MANKRQSASHKGRQAGTFGAVQQRASGRYRARYYGPDKKRYSAPTTFLTEGDARDWLTARHAEIIEHRWNPPVEPKQSTLTFEAYANDWLDRRELADRTREHYRDEVLDPHLIPKFGARLLASISSKDVEAWHLQFGKRETPTMRAHCYSLLRTIMESAVDEEKINRNPCTIKGAGSATRKHLIRPATPEQLQKIIDEMPARFQAIIPLAAWCALRFGELAELRRRDIDLDDGVIRVRRGVVRLNNNRRKIKAPKSEAGIRDVTIPPHILQDIADHLDAHVAEPESSLLFPADHGGNIAPSTLKRHYFRARDNAGRSDLRLQDLRHTGATMAAQSGATIPELMQRLGHSSPAAAMRYQHIATGRAKEIADQMSLRAAARAKEIADQMSLRAAARAKEIADAISRQVPGADQAGAMDEQAEAPKPSS